ncbi:ammonia-dependent NAD(+) synthetase [Arthrobacter sp. zg-Y859]|uniref:NH(3)-dependent NAD(+) synthetase n=1 Tax=Arthrobacter jinronghuae TaxID=2964609 RepID=A0ABT1NKW1_9MICC|nr:ammonia-dependent NAD(+) synthetase [Arthrobacter jinronghuae]MCQ1948361.1 ammonia-dependent NAD(+) synthetase [Arthrobacter jinronghuae]UWX78801.1 ammonia-dependent NAD(+) synthetase [Arthrobacter jinronghuae]
MRKLQAEIIAELGVHPTIDAAAEIRRRVDFLKDYLHASHTSGYVLGISGGVDSTLAGKLAQLAVDELKAEGTDAQFIALRLPYRVQHDEADAQAALEFIAPSKSLVYNVGPAVDGFEDEYVKMTGEKITDFNKGNIKARVRMTAQYAVAGQHNLLVIGTDHGAESVTGFFTKFGDGGADLLPLSGLDKRQNRALLTELGAPEKLIGKAPTADLLDDKPGQTDETELGLSYDTIDGYLEGGDTPAEDAEKIEARFVMTRHKRTVPVTVSDTWWK